jgi:hypothetical protein
MFPGYWYTHGHRLPVLGRISTPSLSQLRATLHRQVFAMGNRQQIDRGVHVSTALHHANQCITATLDESHIIVNAKSSDDAINSTLGSHAMRRWSMVTSDERCGMLFAPA